MAEEVSGGVTVHCDVATDLIATCAWLEVEIREVHFLETKRTAVVIL